MLIDTRYASGGKMIVKMTLEDDEERALTPDLLIRVGSNQHRLRWPNGINRAHIDANPATFRVPASHREATVKRRGRTVTVIYCIADT